MTPATRRFARRLAIIAAVSVVIRVAYVVIERRDAPVQGDGLYYHYGSNLLAQGHGFIVPLEYVKGLTLQAADHPPLYLLWLAATSVFGLESPLTHMLWTCVLGTATVVVLGFVGREVIGPRAGLVAGGLAAVYPNIWSHDGMLQSESLAILLVAIALLLAYRFWRAPSFAKIVALGVVSGLAALTRSELILLVPFVVLPLVLITSTIGTREKLKWLGLAGAGTAVVVAPWIGYNLTRFKHPVFLSTGYEVTLLTASCDKTWYGQYTGYWSFECGIQTPRRDDQSQRAIAYRRAALDYIGDNKARIPVVVAARWGRITGLFRPAQQVRLDHVAEGRETWVAWMSLSMFYPIAVLAIAGAIALRRRRVLLFPLVALPGIVLISVTLTFATNRYRAIAEPALVVLAAVALDAGVQRIRTRGQGRDAVAPDALEDETGEQVLARP
jgi:4-amino-4-deoxy-L-arabinose transferase-like glycosyltransferase